MRLLGRKQHKLNCKYKRVHDNEIKRGLPDGCTKVNNNKLFYAPVYMYKHLIMFYGVAVWRNNSVQIVFAMEKCVIKSSCDEPVDAGS